MEAPEKLHYEAHKLLPKLGSPELSKSDLQRRAGIKKSTPLALQFCTAPSCAIMNQKIRWANGSEEKSKLVPALIVLLREHRERNRDLLKISQNNKMIRVCGDGCEEGWKFNNFKTWKIKTNCTCFYKHPYLILQNLGVTLTMI